jgi:hypothetical protein
MIARTARKASEVIVKISGGGRNMKHIKAHFDYISRNGEVELEDENGDRHLGREAVSEVRDAWAKGRIGISDESEKRKEAFNIVLSMPPGTDRQGVKAAVRNFAQERFSAHQYAFAAHDDEEHPHIHLAVKAVDRHGVRMNPRKHDLQLWREQFAEKLREQGIEANATTRRARGIVQKSEKQAVRHMDIEFKQGKRKAPARVSQAQQIDAELEANTGRMRNNPVQDHISLARKQTQKAYGEMARALATGDAEERRLALDIVRLVKTMPPVITKHETLVQALRGRTGKIEDSEKLRALEQDRVKSTEGRDR